MPRKNDGQAWINGETDGRASKAAGTIANPPGYVIVHGGQVHKVQSTFLYSESFWATPLFWMAVWECLL